MDASTVMKSRPILFSGPMVRAILDGRKTQTRRIVKPQPPDHAIEVFDWRRPDIAESAKANEGCYYNDMDGLHFHCKCPYGTVGDRLWVRETFSSSVPGCEVQNGYAYRADHVDKKHGDGPIKITWTPSIHMPRKASRITLEITGVCVERLNAISGRDVLAEGVDNGSSNPTMGIRWENMQRMAFESLWESINGPGSWALNFWIWVVSFERLS